MTPVAFLMLCAAALLGTALLAIAGARSRSATPIVYGATLVITVAATAVSIATLIGHAPSGSLVLPIGLPWIGAHFRVDMLSAFFLGVVNAGGAAASLYAIGYGRHEEEPHRVLPFFAALPNPEKRYVIVPGAGHLMHLQAGRTVFARAVIDFLGTARE